MFNLSLGFERWFMKSWVAIDHFPREAW
jgi:hypothetical protein